MLPANPKPASLLSGPARLTMDIANPLPEPAHESHNLLSLKPVPVLASFPLDSSFDVSLEFPFCGT